MWDPPGTWRISIGQQLAMLPSLVGIYGRDLPRVIGALTKVEKHHPTDPHEYLAFVGVAPERQGRGIGSMILKPVLDRTYPFAETADAIRYVETGHARGKVIISVT